MPIRAFDDSQIGDRLTILEKQLLKFVQQQLR
jgi:hypothetical protein